MKYLKEYNEFKDIDPFDEEDWNENEVTRDNFFNYCDHIYKEIKIRYPELLVHNYIDRTKEITEIDYDEYQQPKSDQNIQIDHKKLKNIIVDITFFMDVKYNEVTILLRSSGSSFKSFLNLIYPKYNYPFPDYYDGGGRYYSEKNFFKVMDKICLYINK